MHLKYYFYYLSHAVYQFCNSNYVVSKYILSLKIEIIKYFQRFCHGKSHRDFLSSWITVMDHSEWLLLVAFNKIVWLSKNFASYYQTMCSVTMPDPHKVNWGHDIVFMQVTLHYFI